MEFRQPSDCAYLLLTGEVPPNDSQIRIVASLNEALQFWAASTRVSPIVAVVDGELAAVHDCAPLGEVVAFLGPVHPASIGDLPHSTEWGIWATFGSLNIVVSLPSGDCSEILLPFATQAAVPIEIWVRNDNGYRYESVFPSNNHPITAESLTALSSRDIPTELVSATSEYIAQTASALARARLFFPEVVLGFVERVTRVEKTLATFSQQPLTTAEIYRTLGLLIQLNSGLSRFTSQAFSGTTPLLLTECHFWTHSLLGTGVANRALHTLSNFLEMRLGRAKIPQRLEALGHQQIYTLLGIDPARINQEGIGAESDESPWWNVDLLTVPIDAAEEAEPVVPTITYFSARDGFKSTVVTLSAPLASITQCATRKWSLVTATHELSHNLTRGILSLVYPRLRPFEPTRELDLTDSYTLDYAFRLINYAVDQKQLPNTLLDHYRLLFIDLVLAMEAAASGGAIPLVTDQRELRDILEHWHHEIEELITHIVDFLYFYDGDEEEYISSIWLSWSVIPNIHSRVREYVVRSLCTLLSGYPSLSLGLMDTVRQRLKGRLEKLVRKYAGTLYVAEAVELLDASNEEWSEIADEVVARFPLIRFSARVVVSPTLREQLADIPGTVGKPSVHAGFDHHPLVLRGRPVSNPLAFVKAFARASEPSLETALWLLMMLAFNCSVDE